MKQNITLGSNEICDMDKRIQDKIAAMKAQTAAMNALADALNRQTALYRQQADEAAIELAKMRAEIMRAEPRKAQLLQKYTALKNQLGVKHYYC